MIIFAQKNKFVKMIIQLTVSLNFLIFQCQFYQSNMSDIKYPVPHSHKTFQFGSVIIDSNFDSGNLYSAEKVSNNTFDIWLGVDHPKNQYRTWFYFSLMGVAKGAIVTFNIKNMQNQSRLLGEGLVPVFRQAKSEVWKRIIHKVDVSRIQYNEGWIEWTFKHTMTSEDKVFFAFFYPWSNTQNDHFLSSIADKSKLQQDLYFNRSTIIRSLQGRPVQFVTISSTKGITNKSQKFQDQNLFKEGGEPKQFIGDKKCIVIGARVHPGQVPSSHVMTGIITELTQNSEKARLLRDRFVFYIFPIFNPDGVARGHYRVDTNGINLNRCYLNPSPKNHPPIYAVKKIIVHFHQKGKYFGFLDLHAHAARRGVFIYGNSSNELQKQVQICLFPKILSMNSQIFQYEGSNFTEKNMYCKDLNDHVSKEGAGRVAIFKATKNPYSWTLECNYNSSRVLNIIDAPRLRDEEFTKPTEKDIDTDLIINYKYPNTKEPKQFYTIQQFRELGKAICCSFLDLIQLNPESRIDNSKSHFKSIQNLRMNLAVALLRMAPSRFQSQYKKIYHCLEGNSTSELTQRGLKALYLMLIKKAKIQKIGSFLKQGDQSSVVLPVQKSLSPSRGNRSVKPIRPTQQQIRVKQHSSDSYKTAWAKSGHQLQLQEQDKLSTIKFLKKESEQYFMNEDCPSEMDSPTNQYKSMLNCNNYPSYNIPQNQKLQALKLSVILNSQLLQINIDNNYQRILGRQNQMPMEGLRSNRKSLNTDTRKIVLISNSPKRQRNLGQFRLAQLPSLIGEKAKAISSISSLGNDIKFIRKAFNIHDQPITFEL